ncbi:MAG: flavoprotein-like protein, partial [Olpidium bornovanus]
MPAPAGPPPHLLSFSALDLAVALAAVACAAAYVFKAELAARLPPLLRLLARRPAAAAAAAAPPLSPARTRASPAAAARPEASESRGTGARDIAQKMKEADKDAVFFFGSQTGTAEEYAARLAKEGAARYSLKTMTADLMDYDASFLDRLPPDKLAFFVLATYGEGEPTDNAIDFWNFLKAAEVSEFSRAACGGEGVGEADGGTEDEGGAGAEGEGDERGKKTGKKQLQQPLRNLRYVVYGLGNKTYEHYNAVAKTVSARFAQLGAQSVAPAGYGDDDGNLEDDFIQWKEKMWPDVA